MKGTERGTALKGLPKLFGVVSLILCFAMSMAVAPFEVAAASKTKIFFRINSQAPADERIAQTGHPVGVASQTFLDEIKKNGDNLFDVRVFYNEQLAKKIDQTLIALKSGGFEMGGEAYGNMGGVTDGFIGLNFPFLFNTYDRALRYWEGPIGQRMRAKAEKDLNIKIIYSAYLGFRHITNSKTPVHVPADMKGLKIRTMNDPYQVASMKALGAAPTPMAYSELFTALQQKVVDGQENPIANIYVAKIYEVQKYLTKTGHNFTWLGTFVGRDWFDKLPPEAQKLLMDSGKSAEAASLKALKKMESKIEKELMEKHKMEIYQPTADELKQFQNACQSIWGDLKNKTGEEYYNLIMKEAGVTK